MNLETIIGLEIHAQLSTKSKLWCSCSNNIFSSPPNTHVCPICMGFPGMLPTLNQSALEKAIIAGKALGCEILLHSKFDRKNYFYPDLPLGFQISQFDQPIALKGILEFPIEQKICSTRITRIHLENDAGKLTHTQEETLCDYNRSGCPLIEIVTEPDLRSAEQAQTFAKELQKILRAVGASYADMEKGMMRFDASISLRPQGESTLYARTEIKNLNSFTALKKALLYEEERQKKLWEKGQPPSTETTVGWIDTEGKTQLLREKESADDYRYFPEPDLPPLALEKSYIEKISKNLPELPLAKFKRYQAEYQLPENDALKLCESESLSSFYEESVRLSQDPKKSAQYILTEVLRNSQWEKTPITPQHIADVLMLLQKGLLSSTGAKTVLQTALEKEGSAEQIMKDLQLEQSLNTDEMETWVEDVLKENPNSVEDYKNGKDKALQYLMGQVMKKSKGKANPPLVMKMLKEKI